MLSFLYFSQIPNCVHTYFPSSINQTNVLTELHGAVSDLQCSHLDGSINVAGDFNHVNFYTSDKRTKTTLRVVKTWPQGAMSALRDCFESIDLDIFKQAATSNNTIDLEEYTSVFTSYIRKCIDDMAIAETIIPHSNQKPWMAAEVRALFKARDSAYR